MSNRFTRNVVVKGIPLEVEFEYYEGFPATLDEPEAPDEIFIEAVFVDGIDIYHLMGKKGLAEVEKELWKILDNKEDVIV
jgi:hypothetical protein